MGGGKVIPGAAPALPTRPPLRPTPPHHGNSPAWPDECLESRWLSCLHPCGCMQAVSTWQCCRYPSDFQQSTVSRPVPSVECTIPAPIRCAKPKSHQYRCRGNDDCALAISPQGGGCHLVKLMAWLSLFFGTNVCLRSWACGSWEAVFCTQHVSREVDSQGFSTFRATCASKTGSKVCCQASSRPCCRQACCQQAAQSSSQLHPVRVMPVERVQKFKVVWFGDKQFHTVAVVDDRASEQCHLMRIMCVACVLQVDGDMHWVFFGVGFVSPCNHAVPAEVG